MDLSNKSSFRDDYLKMYVNQYTKMNKKNIEKNKK